MEKKPTVTPLSILTMISMYKYTVLAIIVLIVGIIFGSEVLATNDEGAGWKLVFVIIISSVTVPAGLLSIVTGIFYTIGIFKNKPLWSFISCLVYTSITGLAILFISLINITTMITDYASAELVFYIVSGIAFLLCVGFAALHIVTIVKMYRLHALSKNS
ncbi:MAG: hypothetical protein MJ094_01140 [Saccharofermentans sp.]|nr:hypothetical protein [Saccharofermentans sp.]